MGLAGRSAVGGSQGILQGLSATVLWGKCWLSSDVLINLSLALLYCSCIICTTLKTASIDDQGPLCTYM